MASHPSSCSIKYSDLHVGTFVEMLIDDGQPLDTPTESAMLPSEGTVCCTPGWLAGDVRQYAPVSFVPYNDRLSAASSGLSGSSPSKKYMFDQRTVT